MHELHVPPNVVRFLIHLWQNTNDSLLDNIVESIEKFMVNCLCLLRKVKLIDAIHVIQTL